MIISKNRFNFMCPAINSSIIQYMAKNVIRGPEDYIESLDINGMEGRVLHLPAPKKGKKKNDKEILFVYGHHSSLERWWGVMLVLNRYAAVTMPDLPGFGGMDSFYKIGMKPDIDNMADYLAAFIKLRYKRKKITIAGMSFGFIVVTRMLQKYPELHKKVNLVVSIVGFNHRNDFKLDKKLFYSFYAGASLLTNKVGATIFRYTALLPIVLNTFYAKTPNAKHKFKDLKTPEDFKKMQEVEVRLWHDNDVQTWAYTTLEMFKLDNVKYGPVDIPLWHVGSKGDHFFDNKMVDKHMKQIYKKVNKATINMTSHAPSVIADEKTAAPLVPPKLQTALRNMK